MRRFIRAVLVLSALILVGAASNRLAGQATPPGGERAQRPAGAGRGGPGGAPAARQEPARSTRVEFPGVFLREDFKINPSAPNVNNADEPEQPITAGNGANPNVEVRVYGDRGGTRI